MKMFRKRFIPDEIIDISKDILLKIKSEYLITKWEPIHPRNDIGSGESFVFFKEGFKISKFYDTNGNLLYWYCDIIDYEYRIEKDEYIFIDLLVDVKITNGKIEVLDLDELKEALDKGLIDNDKFLRALNKLNRLIKLIESKNDMDELVAYLLKTNS